MEHKAFVFDYDGFQRELRPLLERALASENPDSLIAFIKADLQSFRDPYEGDRLEDDWEDVMETKDVHQYGDFALTKYYDPGADIGLGREWEEIGQVLEMKLGTRVPVLGHPITAHGRVFDPGKMGSYFQSEQDIQHNLAQIEELEEPRLSPLVTLLKRARAEQTGLYVTF
ncbi:MAG: hypothetical protein ACE15E_25210 [Acidobacteriota bacterium]